MFLRRMLLGGVAAVALGGGLACPSLAQAATVPQGFEVCAKCADDHHDKVGNDSDVHVNVVVIGNNNGGSGGDSSGASADNNGDIHDIIGGIAKADAAANATAKARNGHHQHHRG